jgi:DNA modification methylase
VHQYKIVLSIPQGKNTFVPKTQIQEYKVVKIPLSKIKLDDTNPNVVPKETMASIRKIMKKYGYLDPVIVDKNHVMVDGEHRFKIYQEFGKTEIPTIIATKCSTTTDRKMLRQYLNKVRGKHDKKKDALEFKAIFEDGHLDEFTKILGTPIEDIQRQLEKEFDLTFGVQETDPVPERPAKPKSKLGEIYQLGRHKIMCGDCTNPKHVEKLLNGKTVDQLLTDPPYGVDYAKKNEYLNRFDRGNRIQKAYANDERKKNFADFFSRFLKLIPFSDYNTAYIFMSGRQYKPLLEAAESAGLYHGTDLVWVKNNHVLGPSDYLPKHELCFYGWKGRHKFYGPVNVTTVLEYDKPQVNDLHPTMKPVEMFAQLLQDGSKKGATIYEPFLGSGTTLIASEQTGRTCYGMELDPGYVDVIITRWENLTGKKVKKL